MTTSWAILKSALFRQKQLWLLLRRQFKKLAIFDLSSLFSINLPVYKITDDQTQTADHWRWKRSLYQQCHNHCPEKRRRCIDETLKVPRVSARVSSSFRSRSSANQTSIAKSFLHSLKNDGLQKNETDFTMISNHTYLPFRR